VNIYNSLKFSCLSLFNFLVESLFYIFIYEFDLTFHIFYFYFLKYFSCKHIVSNKFKKTISFTSAVRTFGPGYFRHSVSILDPRHIGTRPKGGCLLVSVAKDRSHRGTFLLRVCENWSHRCRGAFCSKQWFMQRRQNSGGVFCNGTRLVVVILQRQRRRFPMAVLIVQSRASRRWCSFSGATHGGRRRREADLVRKTEQ